MNKRELVLAVLCLGIRRAKPAEGYERGQKCRWLCLEGIKRWFSMHLCGLSHTDRPACAVMSVCKGRRVLRACGYMLTCEHTEGPRGTCCGTLSATTVTTPTSSLWGWRQPDAPSGFIPAQWQEQCIFLCACQLALLSQAQQCSRSWLFPFPGVQVLWEQATPRTYLAASSSLCAVLAWQSLSFPLLSVLLLLL